MMQSLTYKKNATENKQNTDNKNRKVIFMFPEMIGNVNNIGLELYRSEPFFQKQVDDCLQMVNEQLGLEISLWNAEEVQGSFNQTIAAFIVQFALAKVFIDLGILPEAMIASGVGGYVAACLAGVIEIEDIIKLLAKKTKQKSSDLTQIQFNPPAIPYISSAIGTWVTESNDLAYWLKQLEHSENLNDSITELLKWTDETHVLIEMGGEHLSQIIKQHPKYNASVSIFNPLPSQNPKLEKKMLLETLGALWSTGMNIDWEIFSLTNSCTRVPLPSYPFERKSYWINPVESSDKFYNANVAETYDEHEVYEEQVGKVKFNEENPRDNIESKLEKIWHDIFGKSDIGIHENFFDLGGDSLMGVELMHNIRKVFQLTLPISKLFEFPTIESLARLIRQENVTTLSPIVPINSNGRLPPLFCVHPIGGSVLTYSKLSHYLGNEQPFYGIQQVDYPKENYTIESLAEFYLSQIRSKQPKGPYFLIGWSLGGLIAYEMVKQLESINEKIAYLSIIDCTAHHNMTKVGDLSSEELIELFVYLFWGDIAKEVPIAKQLKDLPIDQQLSAALNLVKKANLISIETEFDEFKKWFLRFKNNLYAAEIYQPKLINSDIELFIANEPFEYSNEETDQFQKKMVEGWQRHTRGQVIASAITGNHFTLLQEPGVTAIAKQMQISLKKTKVGT